MTREAALLSTVNKDKENASAKVIADMMEVTKQIVAQLIEKKV